MGCEGAQQHFCVIKGSLGQLEGAGRNVEKGHADFLAAERERGQPVVFAGFEQVVVVGDAWGNEFRHTPFHQLFGELGVFKLVAHGHFVAVLHEPRQVVVNGVVRNAGHFDKLAVARRLAREHDAQHSTGFEGIFTVGFIKIADTVQQDGFGILGFDLEILLEHRRSRCVFLFHCKQKYRKNRRRMLSL